MVLNVLKTEEQIPLPKNPLSYVHPTQGAIETHMCNEHDAPEFICYMCSFASMNSRVVYLHLQNVNKYKTDV